MDWDRLAGTLVREQVALLHKESSSGRIAYTQMCWVGSISWHARSRRLKASELRSRDGGGSWYGEGNGVSIADSPELVARLTVEAVRMTIQVAVEQLQQIANDRVMLHEWIDWQGIDGVTRALVVQHKASGLCARFHLGHFIQPAKIADLVGYLLGPSGPLITGQRLVVCAGASL